MPSITALIGSGLPARLATILGYTVTTRNAAGTTQAGATTFTTNLTNGITSGGNTAFILGTFAPGAGPIQLYVSTATSATVFPPVGGTIQGGAVNASFTVPANKIASFECIAPLTYICNLSA